MLNYNLKIISGWIITQLVTPWLRRVNTTRSWVNNSGKVTSQNNNESKKDNRWSKSITYINTQYVHEIEKEQRVDGSWQVVLVAVYLLLMNIINKHTVRCKPNLQKQPRVTCLRCTLMGCESSYQVKILSKQISNIRRYSIITSRKSLTITKLQFSLNPWFFTGFSDAEGSFSILIQINSQYATGWRIKPIFTIGLHKKDLDLLKNIQSYLGIGKIHIRLRRERFYTISGRFG